MPTDRVTVSLDEETKETLEDLTDRTGESQSQLIREAIAFYAANFDSAHASDSDHLQTYYEMLSTGEHVLLDIDLLHALLSQFSDPAQRDEGVLEMIDQVAQYHAQEYAERFDSLEDVLEWLSLCGFLTVRRDEKGSFHVVFPSESVRWLMIRFIRGSITDLPFEIEIEESVSKVLLRER
ncbi:CopG family transcripitonal regulator (plasmid) [Haloarcula hispanica N601]|uniref:CopG family transcripitonal regulator n=4 Tax=Haloarcula hispanica TaxID=51589 RepID=V5TTK2_HALHI|nr:MULTISPECIES: ribbon-helix-helix protein, CopG family [Haloarcula]AEM59163.1 CopG family ribbon-helix-helix transcription regulator [Haloarcula hispanica ATCC 33960]AHB68035.1 CopG family transcripitonal regulator [Haloarcula hispanica N601]AJF27643.1 CopG family transcriptional regulator [Haloarcula sp. CBA1115]KAA9404384.1 CopG family transcriptional regulator [Haloarcula sp. CBA1131]KAA9404749.1 CopG family transcriptional regulator [Haloarcula hispanica]